MKTTINRIAIVGIALGAVFGMAGTMVSQDRLRAASWTVDGAGLVVAAALLALKFFRRGSDCLAAGFLVFAIAEAVMMSGNAAGLAGSVPSFAAGTALWSAALMLTSIPAEFPIFGRIAGMLGAVLFAITSGRISWGEPLLPTAAPLPYYGYPFLVLTFLGWIWTLAREV